MKDLIITIRYDDRKVELSRNFIAVAGENMQGNIVVDFKNKEDFVDGFAYFELNQKGEKYFIKMEKDEENKVYTLPILSSLSKYACRMECQITIRESDTETAPSFKSNVFYLYCNEAINAVETIPDQYPLWFEEVNKKLAYYDELIKDISTHVEAKMGVSKVVLNKSLTKEQIISILSSLEYEDEGACGNYYYFKVLDYRGFDTGNIQIYKLYADYFEDLEEDAYVIEVYSGDEYIYIYSSATFDFWGDELVEGWNENYEDYVEFYDCNDKVNYGEQNNKVSEIFTVVPKETKNVELIGVYDGTYLNTDEIEVNVEEMIYKKQLPLKIKHIDMLQSRINEAGCSYLFYNYSVANIDYIKNLDTSSVRNMSNMFFGATYIKNIPYLNTPNVTNMEYMFNGCKNLIEIPLLDTRNVTNMQYMFRQCLKLTTIPQLDTSKVTTMYFMFEGCSSLTEIPQLDTSKVTTMQYMLQGCKKLTIVPQLDTSKVTNVSFMFNNCNELQKIDITHMNITSTAKSDSFAYYCYSLTKLIIRNMDTIPVLNSSAFYKCYHFDGTVNTTYNPDGLKDGRIYVPDDKVEELKSATNWSTYADIIVPLSELEE